ncbi:MAG: hypothetical protein IT410_00340 [Candidatus Doudnabacteria bacterium]|nr:hypothetical protein [Candidatus Doudnabacteria bacterium]
MNKNLIFSWGLIALLLLTPHIATAALTVGATSVTTDSTLSLQGGNVGVGVTTPSQLFEIGSSAAAHTQLTIQNTNAGDYNPQIGFQIVAGTNKYTMGIDDTTGDRFRIKSGASLTGADSSIVLEGAGDVGIGVADPAFTLHVSDNVTTTSFVLTNSTAGVGGSDGLLFTLSNSDATIYNQEADGGLFIGSGSGILQILADGNVGINTYTPTEKLDIDSDNIRIRTAKSPASNAVCDAGEISWDTNYVYICTATNTWKRAALTGGY